MILSIIEAMQMIGEETQGQRLCVQLDDVGDGLYRDVIIRREAFQAQGFATQGINILVC